jgi:hypothetical protein
MIYSASGIENLSADNESFILEAIKEKLDTLIPTSRDTSGIKNLLAEGYEATQEEDLEITRDFE